MHADLFAKEAKKQCYPLFHVDKTGLERVFWKHLNPDYHLI